MTERRTICLWDFSWYVRTAPGDAFHDLDRAARETRERGFTTVRICAMPFLLFGSGLDTTRLRLGPLPGGVGRGTRWYDVAADTTIDARAQLLAMFQACDRAGLDVIVSSWEYQQSPAFALEPQWYERLVAVDPDDRPVRLAEACADLLDFLAAHSLDHLVLFTELHNEVASGYLTDGLDPAGNRVLGLHDRLRRGIDRFHERHPDRLCTVNYAGVPVGAMRGIPDNADVLALHPYVYGMLGELIDDLGLRTRPFDPGPLERTGLLRPGAPRYADRQVTGWRADASVIGPGEMYAHDNVDPTRWDAWLAEHHPRWRIAMEQQLDTWLEVAADHAVSRGVPLVLGEGWIGYTPLHGRFEEGPIGVAMIQQAMRTSARVGASGAVVCSNAAPHHPMWADVATITEANRTFRDTPAETITPPAIRQASSTHRSTRQRSPR